MKPRYDARADIAKMDQSSLEAALMKQYATPDYPLNQHVFGNVSLKYLDFTSPQIYSLFKIKKPDTKQQAYL